MYSYRQSFIFNIKQYCFIFVVNIFGIASQIIKNLHHTFHKLRKHAIYKRGGGSTKRKKSICITFS